MDETKRTDDSTKQTTPRMKWFTFYAYIFLPLSILFGYGQTGSEILRYAPETNAWETPMGIYLTVLQTVAAIFIIFVICGLHKRKLWGWHLNIVLLVGKSLTFALNEVLKQSSSNRAIAVYIGLTLFAFLIWFLPNFVYFKNRKNLFA